MEAGDGVFANGPPSDYEGSTFEKVMNTPVAQPESLVAAFVVFNRDVTKKDAAHQIKQLDNVLRVEILKVDA